MDNKKWADDMIYQRMELLLDELYRSKQDEETEDVVALNRAEALLKRMSGSEWEAVNQLLEQTMERHARETAYLYTCGFEDGVRVMKFINGL